LDLKLYGRERAQRSVPAPAVVEHLEVLEHRVRLLARDPADRLDRVPLGAHLVDEATISNPQKTSKTDH
jgi:hypothetical protein